MDGPLDPTLDQLRIFLAVVDAGSFAGAARALGRAVSVVSYGIGQMEAALGVALFDRAGTRRPVLTEAGRAVLVEARGLAAGVDSLRARVRGLSAGLEAEVGLAVDVMLPAARLGAVLRAFASAFPTVQLRLHVEALGAVSALVLDGTAALGISGPLFSPSDALDSAAAGNELLVPVAAPGHPLARMAGEGAIPPGAARAHTQLVLTDRSPLTEGRDFSVLSPHTWRLADLGAKLALLREGIGWGNMPAAMVAEDLAAGRLVRLELPEGRGQRFAFSAIWRRDAPPGPAGQWLRARFTTRRGG